MKPTIIFDFGNVVAYFDYAIACAPLAARLGLDGPTLLSRARGVGLTELVAQFESGAMDAQGFSREVCTRIGLADVSHDEFAAAWSDIFWANEPVGRLVAELRGRDYRLILGSNTNDLHATHFRVKFAETLAHFDRLVFSYEVGQIKPSAAFFLACAEAAGAAPADCIFIDDMPENVEGASAVGMTGIIYRDTPKLRSDLASHGVEVDLESPAS